MLSALKIKFDGTLDAGNVLATIALLVSLTALLRPWWRERMANIEVRNEQYASTLGNRPSTSERYVIKNHGPARARDVEVAFRYSDGRTDFRTAGYNEPSTPVLHPGEELHLKYALMLMEELPERVIVSWKDRRLRRVTQEFFPALREL